MQQLKEWIKENPVGVNMGWREAANNQFRFVREIWSVFYIREHNIGNGITDPDKAICVVGSHTSKSIKLPVYHLMWFGVEITMRANFYNWKVSVKSDRPILISKGFHLFDRANKESLCYCEGFTEEQLFGSYDENNQQFTVSINDKYDLYCLFKIIAASYC